MKKEGLRSGVPDIFVAEPRGSYHGLFIEMKSKNGKVSQDQKTFLEKAGEKNYFCFVCFSFEEARGVVKSYLEIQSSSSESS